MTFLENILERLRQRAGSPVLAEVRDGALLPVTGSVFLGMVQQARNFLGARGLKRGDRCVLLAPNSIEWAALDLAMMAQGLVVAPLYARQAPAELVAMMKDAMPARICCGDAALAAEINRLWPGAPKITLLESVFLHASTAPAPPLQHSDAEVVTIIYTSGTSGEPKGVMLTAGNVNYMVGCTTEKLNQLMDGATGAGANGEPERIFHYAPFCFAASWMLLLSALSRNSTLTLSTDLSKLSGELKLAAPNYFLNVPTLLERVRTKINEAVQDRGGFAAKVFGNAQDAYRREQEKKSSFSDSLWLRLANWMIFPAIRQSIGPNLKALICGSAPLAAETQLFYMMLGIPVLQAYGLTETTAICTLDDPKGAMPGRVGRAVPGVEMKVGENDEILARGPNIFAGYWQRPAETEKALEGGWFHTGDQGDVDASGNWRITGRLKNLIILNSGHNIAPEPIEEALAAKLPEAEHVVLIGNQRGYLSALVTTIRVDGAGEKTGLSGEKVQSALDELNPTLPHYKQIRAFEVIAEPFMPENGLLTGNGKYKREAIAARYAAEIERLYQKKGSSA
ncbi:MAG: AMP-binding protein [Candidatus Acidiferrales bacterium]